MSWAIVWNMIRAIIAGVVAGQLASIAYLVLVGQDRQDELRTGLHICAITVAATILFYLRPRFPFSK